MNIFTAINMAELAMELIVKYEPSIEKDIKDIMDIIDRIRNQLAQTEGQK